MPIEFENKRKSLRTLEDILLISIVLIASIIKVSMSLFLLCIYILGSDRHFNVCAASAATMDFDAIIRLIHANLYIISAHLPAAAANFSHHRNRIRME
jgi:hypothetical protein